MADKTGIEWTDATWNPTTGCNKVTPGCDNCYAMTLAPRLKAMGSAHYQTDGNPATSGPGFGIAMHPDALDKPLRWQRPRRIFVNSMSDLFHDGVTDDFIMQVFAVMALARQHTFQVLTKRHGRMRSLLNQHSFWGMVGVYALEMTNDTVWLPASGVSLDAHALPNVWLGVSVEDQKRANLRVPALIDTPAAVRWLSCEPLLGPVDLERTDKDARVDGGIDWVVAGGESGPGARPMHPDWARTLRDSCTSAGIPFLFKQWGAWVDASQFDGAGYDAVEMAERGLTIWPDGRTVAGPAGNSIDGSAGMWRVGKKKAGRELDGRTHDEYPKEVARV
jgi:protein gp37